MTINSNLDAFGGLPVVTWEPGDALPDPGGTAVRLMLNWEASDKGASWLDLFAALLADPRSAELAGLVVGAGEWLGTMRGTDTLDDMVQALVAARSQLAGLSVLFIADVTYEECEISWIGHTDYAPILAAYPQLTAFGVRGSEGLSFGGQPFSHQQLRQLTIESGGLPREVVQQVLAADLPELTHLELWLGTPNYGGDATVDDLAPLLGATSPFPKLRYLGLRDAEIADDVAVAIASAPILDQLEVLDLSLGTLGDVGAEALLASEKIRTLKKLDLHHHYTSRELLKRLKALPIEVDVNDHHPDHAEDDRYVSVSE